jgi:eukaryotic-like serine/threonine-protein kinase
MKSEDSEYFEELFHQAAAAGSEAARDELLSRADPELAQAVRAMLDGADDPLWEYSALELEAQYTASDWRPALAGQMFGPYRIVRRIATGGMSFVYEAIRDDAEFQKRVAIKFMQHGIDNAVGIERFRIERQILAQLEHPNIARLLDGGTTSDGMPYLVMEYVEGQPIDSFAKERKLSRVQRLKLFLQVCEAVQYAHQNLVVHRDLKPANILVTVEGTPKLLDFGIAKLLTAESDGQTVSALTPEYASPEQVLGRNAGTVSDVYSLGVLLFVLLAGHLPHNATSAHELVSAICERDPVWEPAGLIDRDLKSVLDLALRKEPDRRYSSVENFSGDVRRYLDGHPVSSRSGAVLYRMGKFVKRRAIALAATAVVLIAIGVGVAATLAQSRRVQRRFEEVRTLAHSVLFDVYDSVKFLPGSLPARRLMVARAQQYLDSLSREAAGDPGLVRDLAESYLRLGDVRGGPYAANLGDTAGALESYRKAQRLIEAAAARRPQDSELSAVLAQACLSLGRVLNRQNRTGEALDVLRRSIEIMGSLVARFPDNAPYREKLARAYQYWAEPEANEAFRSGSVERMRAALNASEKAVAIQEAAGQQPGEAWRSSLSAKYFSVGYQFMALSTITGDRTWGCKALDAQLRGHAINRAIAAAHPAQPNRQLADGLLSTASSRWTCRHDFDGTMTDLRQATDVFERLVSADPQNIEARRDLANVYWELGIVLTEAGRKTRALAANRKALAILQGLEQADPASVENARLLTAVRGRLHKLETK